MPWTITKPEPGTSTLILDAEGQAPPRLVGSVASDGPCFRVEIMWSGQGGDIRFKSNTFDDIQAFAAGVEAVFDIVIPPSPEVVTPNLTHARHLPG
jgi:hypothetical protein